jgi:hypothetical protein
MGEESFFVISRFNEDVSWIKEYTDNYIIFNKGEELGEEYKSINFPNYGGNQHDIFNFIYENYESLPDIMVFVQGDPFDHCKKESFDNLIKNKTFTALEDHKDHPDGPICQKDVDGGYREVNNSWYISATNNGHNLTCRYGNYDDFMNSVFSDYRGQCYVKFAPGSQYIVEKDQILKYSRAFWRCLRESLPKTIGINGGTEAHVIERSMTTIFLGEFESKGDEELEKLLEELLNDN